MVCFWSKCKDGSKIFFATWIEFVMMMILDNSCEQTAWMISHLMVKNLASELVTLIVWWRVFVMNLFLRVRDKNNSCIRETQENSIEFLVQNSLSYILLLMVHAHYCAPYPNNHMYDMRLTCVVHAVWHHFIPKLSTPFSQVLWSVLWLHHQFVTDVTVWPIHPNPSCSKNRKWKEK